MVTIKKIFFYAFALFNLISLIYSMGYDYMTGAEIHYDFYGAFFCLLVNILWYIESNFRYINSINSKFEVWLNDTASISFDLF